MSFSNTPNKRDDMKKGQMVAKKNNPTKKGIITNRTWKNGSYVLWDGDTIPTPTRHENLIITERA
jgi:hypothetical protein